VADTIEQDKKELLIQADQEQIEAGSYMHGMGVWVSFVFIWMYCYLYKNAACQTAAMLLRCRFEFPYACETNQRR
jgi:hypothetical protein